MRYLLKIIYVVMCAIATISVLPNSVFAFNGKYDESFYSDNNILFYDPSQKTCASSSGGNFSSLSGNDNREKIWNYLTARGLTAEQAAGILGNIQSESGGTFSPTIQEYGKSFGDAGYGIVQWTGGRRVNVVSKLQEEHPDLMSKYYNADYSTQGKSYTGVTQGFIPKSATTGELMPEPDNDALLLTQLGFLYTESTNRKINSAGIENSSGASADDTEWDAIKKQPTIQDASNVWVYSFEIPDNVDTTAKARVLNGQAIYSLYSNSASGSECESSSKMSLAKDIVSSGNINFYEALDRKIINDVANGSSNGDDLPCGVNINILKILDAIAKAGHKLRVNDLNRGCQKSTAGGLSTSSSRHYAGNGSAMDLGPIDGMSSYSLAGANLILKYAGPYLVDNSGIGQSQSSCLPNLNLPDGVRINRFSDGCNHLHIDLPPNVDQNLKCKVPIYYGGCDESQRG